MSAWIKLAAQERVADASHLQALGQKAAFLAESAGLPLTEAVVETVCCEKLNQHQVQRVVEYTNHEAFNSKFSALLGGPNKAVEFNAGPADPEVVMMQLSKRASTNSEVALDNMDYSMAPMKRAMSVEWQQEAEFRTPEGVRADVVGLRSKLAAAHEDLVGSSEVSLYFMNSRLQELQEQVKIALAAGADPNGLVSAWSRHDAVLGPATADRLFPQMEAGKVASRSINPAHPVVQKFAEFAKEARSYAQAMGAVRELEAELHRVDTWIKGGQA
jgi:hypothetical protein